MATTEPRPSNSPAPKGWLAIKLNKSVYHAGEIVSGDIYLEIQESASEISLKLHFEGEEAVNQVQTYVDETGSASDSLFRKKEPIVKEMAEIFSSKALSSGQYLVPFTFLLPESLPASFYQENFSYACYVAYKLKATLDSEKSCLSGIQNAARVIIRDEKKMDLATISEELTMPLKSCYCLPKGNNILRVNIEKNCYNPIDTAHAVIQLDNSNGKLDLSNISFSLVQKLRLLNGWNSKILYETKCIASRPGVKAGGNVTYAFSIPVPKFRGDDHNLDTEKAQWPRDGDKDLGSTTQGKLVSSEYFLEISCPTKEYNDFHFPKVVYPIQINYPEPPVAPVALPSSSWNPESLPAANVVFKYEKATGKLEETVKTLKSTEMVNCQIAI